jgi:hypothetical protein
MCHLTKRPAAWTANSWRDRICSRLSALPAVATPMEVEQILMCLSLGVEIIRLHRIACRLHLKAEVESALNALARNDALVAIEGLTRLDGMLAARRVTPGGSARLRARGSILAISEALAKRGGDFETEVAL